MLERYLHRCHEQSSAIRTYAMDAAGIDVVGVHKLFAYRVVSISRIDVVSSHEILQNRIWYHKIAECIARYK